MDIECAARFCWNCGAGSGVLPGITLKTPGPKSQATLNTSCKCLRCALWASLTDCSGHAAAVFSQGCYFILCLTT